MISSMMLREKVTYFFSQLKSLGNGTIEIRGKGGLMFAIDFMNEEIAEKVYNDLIESGFIVCNRGTFFENRSATDNK